ncbi:polysaccharide export protein [Altererythrobacter xixiisoli]|uniref:Polysaccharide export protein n=1 Tax=Croceibacterium xixiisoli TaxID=1476466 RepID=A0A6I4TWF6_9SPHN|nr:polysaccharide biosynthesis/export family protein [Croceibacterium xixiisoli]MXO99107.1 polysaccharide export protein [Croceibacterium xixiisoli]
MRPGKAGIVALCLCASGLSACASSNAIRDGYATAAVVSTDLPAPDPRDVGGSIQSAYYVGPSDKLAIFVADLPDMAQTVMVDPAGYISLPYVGRVFVGGQTTEEVGQEITRRLRTSVLVSPQVSVGISETVSQRLAIEGAVSKPGIYPIAGSTTLMRAMALAQGTSNLANDRTVAVFRQVNDQRMVALFDLHMIREGTMADPTIYGNDLIIVETSAGKQLLRDIIGTVPLIGAFYTVQRISR